MLLLWVLWDPIGLSPPDEYASYAPRIADLLREAQSVDAPLIDEYEALSIGEEETAEQARLRGELNRREDEVLEQLVGLLATIRTSQMEVELDPAVERRAAEKILEWYRWEMDYLRGFG